MANLMPMPMMAFFDANGNPLVGGKLFTYLAGSSTLAPSYTDAAGTVANANPVILNARGEAAVWLDPAISYKFVLQTSAGSVIWTVDGVTTGASIADVQKLVGGTLNKSVAGGSNVALSASEAANGILIFTGALTANIAVIVPSTPTKTWLVVNNTTGAFTLTVKTASGAGVAVPQGYAQKLFTSGTNVAPEGLAVTAAGNALVVGNLVILGSVTLGDTSTDSQTVNGDITILGGAVNEAARVDVASASTVDIQAADANYQRITGSVTINAFTLNPGAERTLVFAAGLTLTNSASLILAGGVNLTVSAGDVLVVRGEAGGVVRLVNYMPARGIPLIQPGTVVTLSGASVSFPIPAGVRKITFMPIGMSTSGTSRLQLRLATAGGTVSTGYDASGQVNGATEAALTTGFPFQNSTAAADVVTGMATLVRQTSNTWIWTFMGKTVSLITAQGSIALAAELTSLVLTTTNGTDTFDAGTANVLWEY